MPVSATLQDAVSALKRGEAVVFPTDTVYGLGVAVEAAGSPQVLYDLKERDRGKPIAWLVGGLADLDRYGERVPVLARAAARRFWPGPLTLVVEASDAVTPAFRSDAGTIGLRMPDNAVALALIAAAGCPLATTSANLSGHASPCSFAAIDPVLAERAGTVVADADDVDDAAKSGVASTVLDCAHGAPRIVRAGAVMQADIDALA